MAFEAHLHLRALGEEGLAGERLLKRRGCHGCRRVLVYLMASHAGKTPQLVRAALPEQALPFFVALQAAAVLLGAGQGRLLAEPEDELAARRALVGNSLGARAVVVPRRLDVLASRAVAGLAALRLQIALGSFKEGLGHLSGGEPLISLSMAFLTGVASDVGGDVRALSPSAERQPQQP